jgi:hypothetical protein
VPFQLLGKDVAGVEKVAHDHVDEHDHYDNCRCPGHDTAHPLVDGVYGFTQFPEKFGHHFSRGMSTPVGMPTSWKGAVVRCQRIRYVK